MISLGLLQVWVGIWLVSPDPILRSIKLRAQLEAHLCASNRGEHGVNQWQCEPSRREGGGKEGERDAMA